MADILEALARAFFEVIFELIFEYVFKGTGRMILLLLFGPADRDPMTEGFVGLLFWVGLVALIITIAVWW